VGSEQANEELAYKEAVSTRILPLAYNNRGIAHHSMQHYEEALVDYNMALGLDPNLVYIKLNRAHLFLALGDCYAAIDDLKEVQRLRGGEDGVDHDYVANLYEYCKRYQWGLAVACKDIVAGVRTLPFVDTLDLRQSVNPTTLFDPLKLRMETSRDYLRLQLLMDSFETFGPRATSFLAVMNQAIKAQNDSDFEAALGALVKATYLLPKLGNQSVVLDMREIIVLWRTQVVLRLQGTAAAIEDLRLHLDARLSPISELKQELRLRNPRWVANEGGNGFAPGALEESDSLLLNYLGSLYHHNQEFTKAYEVYQVALDLHRLNISALLNQGNLARAQGRFHLTIECYKRITEALENDPEVGSSSAQQDVFRVLKEYLKVLQELPHEAWQKLGPLQGSLAVAVDGTEESEQTTRGQSKATHQSLEALNQVCDDYIGRLLSSTSAGQELRPNTSQDKGDNLRVSLRESRDLDDSLLEVAFRSPFGNT
jgi:tetratricopeptide (TPR) repeat protein